MQTKENHFYGPVRPDGTWECQACGHTAKAPSRIGWNKFGMTENPIGLKVSLPWKDRTLLGDVQSYRVDQTGRVLLQVRHFNGEQWPVEPLATVVEVIRNH